MAAHEHSSIIPILFDRAGQGIELLSFYVLLQRTGLQASAVWCSVHVRVATTAKSRAAMTRPAHDRSKRVSTPSIRTLRYPAIPSPCLIALLVSPYGSQRLLEASPAVAVLMYGVSVGPKAHTSRRGYMLRVAPQGNPAVAL